MIEKRYVVYNCGYYKGMTMNSGASGKKYSFVMGMVTEMPEEDYNYFIGLTSKDVQWCPKHSKDLLPFMDVKDWCLNKDGKFNKGIDYNPEEFLKVMLLKKDARNN